MAPPILTDDQQAFLLFCKINKKEAQEIVFDYINNNRVNLNTQDKYGNTPLHIAAINSNENVFKALIEAGAKRYIENDNGERAIDIALLNSCAENNEKLVLFLIELGANVNCKDPEGKRPLDYLNKRAPGNIEKVATILIDRGALLEPERLNRFERDNLNEQNRHNPDDRPNSKTRPTKNENPKVQKSSSRER